jgi:16S rRNA (cytosine967-C5)-methyltransferase
MRSIKFNLSKKPASGWDAAVVLTEAYFLGNMKADQVLNLLPPDFIGERRSNCQSLFLGALRHGHFAKMAYAPLLRKKPRRLVESILMVAAFEFLSESADRRPKIVHHAVERSKGLVNKYERGFLNAVLRKLPEALDQTAKEPFAPLSHPRWLCERWKRDFGETSALRLLEWNQKIPSMYVKVFDRAGVEIPDSLEATKWPNFFRIGPSTRWKEDITPMLNRGTAYIKDPSTRLAPELLAPKPGESVLDLCAAPGGKAFDVAHLMKLEGQIVAVDLPGNRIARLKENLDSIQSGKLTTSVVEADILQLDRQQLAASDAPLQYDAVMLDAPCSNTGVIQRRTDVKWRLTETDIAQCAELQTQLIIKAAQFVRPDGRLVYSTCSIEATENEDVVECFLASPQGREFSKVECLRSYPWERGHDGAGATLLKRK